ncbi:MAG TPA: TMEM175 family protein [Puia sp.]|nr:TMEM175 family protein [Puia sp.]
MKKGRLEAFSDGVIAIIITIMVLELRVPHGDHIGDLLPVMPVLGSYVLSFVYIGIYWNNHHHMMYAAERINGAILWSNLNLLFWLSLIPFVTAWMGENHFRPARTRRLQRRWAGTGRVSYLSLSMPWLLVLLLSTHGWLSPCM